MRLCSDKCWKSCVGMDQEKLCWNGSEVVLLCVHVPFQQFTFYVGELFANISDFVDSNTRDNMQLNELHKFVM